MTSESLELAPPYPRWTAANVRGWLGLTGVLAVRNFRVRFLRMRIGVAWPLLQPTIQAGLLYLVFVKIFQVRGVDHYLLYVLSGIMAWQSFQQTTLQAANAAPDNGPLIRKVPVPTVVFPLAAAGTQMIVFGMQAVVLVAGAVLSGTAGPGLVVLPVALVLQTLLALGVGLLVGSFLPRVRDLRIALESALLLLFYASPVLYDPGRLPEGIRSAVRLNPVDGVLQLHRAALVDRPVDALAVAISCVTAPALFALGLAVYRRRSRGFADVL